MLHSWELTGRTSYTDNLDLLSNNLARKYLKKLKICCLHWGPDGWLAIISTTEFWLRLRARALSAPVLIGSLTGKTWRCAPPAQPSGDINDILRKPREKCQFGKKSD
jgi:hypothetical protein